MGKNTDVPPVNPGTYTVPEDGKTAPALLGGFCRECQAVYYPRPKYCPVCLGITLQKSLGGVGTVHSLTVIRTKPPFGLPQPYCVGYIDLDKSGLRVFGLFDPGQIDELRIGDRVCLCVRELGHNGRGEPRLRPLFTLKEGCGEA
jgi:uncharacterized OB-fold protein